MQLKINPAKDQSADILTSVKVRLPTGTFWCGWPELLLFFIIVADFLSRISRIGFISFVYLRVGSNDADHNGSQKSKGCEKGNHVQVSCKCHLSAPDYLCLTGRY